MMNDNNTTHQIIVQQLQALKKKRTAILSLPPEEMVDKILSEKNPAPLVHSFPEEDFYFMVHEIGPEDALPLIALASNRQAGFLMDQEVWEKDRINLGTVSRWTQLMMAADAGRFRKWLMQEKTDILEYFLHCQVEVQILEHDQDPSDFGEDFQTFDNVFYFRILDPIPEPDEAPDSQPSTDSDEENEAVAAHKELIKKLLEEIADEDHLFYQKVLLEATHLLPAEAEEEAYRWRNVRLSEKGFLPFDEAIGIYQPLTLEQVHALKRNFISEKQSDATVMAAPTSPFDLLKEEKLYSQALAVIDTEEEIRRLQEEFAVLCNQIIVADQASVKNRNDLRAIVKKACNYIQIGLDKLSRQETDASFSELIRRHPISAFFSLGFGCALKIKWRTDKWVNESWFKSQGLTLSFWGENWLGVIGGVLIKKPLFYDNYQTGVLYREFASLAEIEETDAVISDIIITDKLLALINVSLKEHAKNKKQRSIVSYKNTLLTLWARHYLNLPEAFGPIPVRDFEPFYKALWNRDEKPKNISENMKTGFLEFLSGETGLKIHEISEQMGHVLTGLFAEIEEEYGAVDYGNIQPRYVHHFLLK